MIGVVDVGETPDGMRYMVMDFAEGQDLAAMLSARRRSRRTRILDAGARRCSRACTTRTSTALIHRDFKPENVIVERDNHGDEVPRIVDFGIAILREARRARPRRRPADHERARARHAALHGARAGGRAIRSITASTCSRSAS